ncbi:MAG: LUD domain-containing protein [Candidatus Limnocylindrales bacterium]
MSGAAARDVVLDRIRAALGDRSSALPIPRAYDVRLAAEVDLAELFAERVADYRATVQRTAGADLPAAIARILATNRARRVAMPSGIPDRWLSGSDVERVLDQPAMAHADLDRLDGVITGCAVAIAETGTVVLDGGEDQGRRALSLLPDLHVCIVRLDQVVGSVPEALARLDPRRPQTWISGPSATSDIELERVEGVHGPRRLAILLVG